MALRPFQVELPLLSVFPDFFQFAYDELRAREPHLAPKKPTVPDKLLDPGAARKWESVVRGVAKKAMPRLKEQLARRNPKLAPLLAVDTDSLVDDALGFAERLLLNRAERAERGRAEYTVELMRLRQNVDPDRQPPHPRGIAVQRGSWPLPPTPEAGSRPQTPCR